MQRKRATATLTLRPFSALTAKVHAAVTAEADAAVRFVAPDPSTHEVTFAG